MLGLVRGVRSPGGLISNCVTVFLGLLTESKWYTPMPYTGNPGLGVVCNTLASHLLSLQFKPGLYWGKLVVDYRCPTVYSTES